MESSRDGSREELLDFIEKYLVVKNSNCYRHCQKPARFVPIYQKGGSLVGAYVCPENYVSRVVYFGASPDGTWFKNFLTEQAGEGRVRGADIRLATRHGWELGGNAEEEIKRVSDSGTLKEYYWTFYPKTEDDKKSGTFLCAKCGERMFSKPLNDDEKFCSNCRN
jgi:hypothetical protein